MLSDERIQEILAEKAGCWVAPHLLAGVKAVAEAAVKDATHPASDASDYKAKPVFTKHDMDRETARLGALIELHMDDSTKLLKMLGVADETKENDHWHYRKECFVDFDKVSTTVKDAVGGRDRESDRHRFPDPAFNRWLDESITENGEFSVWHLLGDITPAWAAWESRPQYERKACDLCDCTGDIHDQTGEWRGECPYCRPQASAAVPDEVIEMADRFMRIAHIYNGMKRSTAERFLDCLGYPDLPIGWESLTLPRLLAMLAASQPEVKNADR